MKIKSTNEIYAETINFIENTKDIKLLKDIIIETMYNYQDICMNIHTKLQEEKYI